MVFGDSTPQNRSASIQWWSKSFYGQSDCSENHLICNSSSKLVDQGLKVQFRGPTHAFHRLAVSVIREMTTTSMTTVGTSLACLGPHQMQLHWCWLWMSSPVNQWPHRNAETSTTSTTTTTAANLYQCLHSIILLVFYALIGAQIATVPGIVS